MLIYKICAKFTIFLTLQSDYGTIEPIRRLIPISFFQSKVRVVYTGKFHRYPVAGICLAGIQDDHIENITKIVSDALNAKGFKVMIFNAFTNAYFDTPYAKGESAVFDIINFDIVDVLVILPETIKNADVCKKIAVRAKEAGTPVFVLDGTIDGCTNITYDYEKSMEDIVEHIITEHGCTDLFFIAGMRGNAFSDERIAAFKRVLDRHGIPFDEEKMLDYGDFWSGPTEEAVERLLNREKKLPQAIICANDSMAVTVMSVLGNHSVEVPEDVIVTGFDSILQKRIYSTTRLTTSAVNYEELAQAVSDTAYGYINNKETPSEIKVGLSFVHGQSCGCCDFDEEYTDDMIDQMNKYNGALSEAENRIASFFTKVAYSSTTDELSASISGFMNYRSWLCVNDDLLSEEADLSQRVHHGSFTKNMTAYVMRHWDEYKYNLKYKSDTMLPELGTMLKRYNTVVFLPIHFQEQAAGYYAAVADDLLAGTGNFYYVQRLVSSIEQALENFRTEYLLKQANKELLRTQSIDPLTGLYNRRGYFEYIDKLIEKYKKKDVVMITCDMDRLKQINDTYGHSEGDIAITTVAKAVKAGCGKNGVCARFGGDEFMLTAMRSDCKRELPKIIGEIQTYIDKFNRSSGKPYEVSISVGGSYGTVSSTEDINELIRSTDHLMYEQKRLKKTPQALFGNMSESTVRQAGKEAAEYEDKIHKIISSFEKRTYFYMSYIDFKWYIKENDSTPKCMISSSVGPLRAIWLSGAIHPDDILLFTSFCNKISKSFNEGITQESVSLNLRLCEDETAEWYNITVHFKGSSGKMEELAGAIRKLSTQEIMNIEIQDYYTTTDNPILFFDIISQKLDTYPDKKFALIQFDIKRFKLINENYGEEAGTEMLHFITRQLSNYCNANQVSARVSGDVFMVMTPYDNKSEIEKTIADIQQKVKNFRNYSYELAFGVYLVENREESVRAICDYAAIARQSIKKSALENVAFFNSDMHRSIKARKFVEANMKKALKNNEFLIYLQPKFSISKKAPVGYETLVRWQNPEQGMIYPDTFIPLFEENGFIKKLDAYVWECTCMVLRDWIDRNFIPLPISVNVSRANLDDSSFIDTLDNLIQKYDLPKNLLELEITESVESEATLRMTNMIKEHGYTLLMDDFGSGYSSLNTLQNTKFDVLKLDREFFSSHMSNDRGKKIIMHTISMSKDVGLGLIAEGVETDEQACFLSDCGCDAAQGYLFAKPMPVQDAEKYLKKKTGKAKVKQKELL